MVLVKVGHVENHLDPISEVWGAERTSDSLWEKNRLNRPLSALDKLRKSFDRVTRTGW